MPCNTFIEKLSTKIQLLDQRRQFAGKKKKHIFFTKYLLFVSCFYHLSPDFCFEQAEICHNIWTTFKAKDFGLTQVIRLLQVTESFLPPKIANLSAM
jgi:hypothetical protein